MNREQSRLELLARLDAAKTQAERNRLGQFATPPTLAAEIVRHAISLLPQSDRLAIRFLEPGFGTGPFFSALAASGQVFQLAQGFEIDPHYGEEAKRLWSGAGLQLTIGDFTDTEPPKNESAKFNVVACNPPYVRHHHLSQAQKSNLRSALSRHVNFEMNGLSGLYTYFMVLSKAWMSEGGVGAWLVPSEFMDVNYGRKLKQFLLENVTLHEIHRCDPQEVQFNDALVSSAIVLFTNSAPPKSHKVKFSFGGSLDDPKLSGEIEADRLRQIPKWTGLPQNRARLATSRSSGTLANLFTIKRGLATGRNSFFVLSSESIEQNGIPKEFLVPILPSPKNLEVNEVTADAGGVPKIQHRRFLLSCNLPDEEVRSKHPSLWRYLEHGMAEGVHEQYLCRHRSPWYSQERRPPAPLLCTYMGRPTKSSNVPFRFILNRSKATAANVYLMLYPKPPLNALFQSEPGILKEVWRALSAITAEMLTGEGRIYGGGLHKLEPKELANVPADVIWEILPKSLKRETQRELFS